MRTMRTGLMRFGYWMPVFGGWLRNVDDEGMEATGRTSAAWPGAASGSASA